MIRFLRPTDPGYDAACQQLRDDIERHMVAAVPDRDQAHAIMDGDGNQRWREHKAPFSRAQHGKCGFCERKLTSDGDIEHFRPKKALHTMLRRGQERPDVTQMGGSERDPAHSFAQGYWWLCYRWSNYLLSCEICNQKWKRNFFPLDPRPVRAPRPGDESTERALLLSPFDGRDPIPCLRYSDLGQIEAGRDPSNVPIPEGQATIETCGLDRESLRSARQEKAVRAHQLVRKLQQAFLEDHPDQRLIVETANDLLCLGRLEHEHAGMVRSIVYHNIELTWAELADLTRL